MGVVVELFSGRDEEVRVARVKTHSKDNKHIILKRPIQRLYPLEVYERIETKNHTETDVLDTKKDSESFPTKESILLTIRPNRLAAKEARERIRLWTEDLNM